MDNYDDMGDGKYDFLGISERIPLHADKAEEFSKEGDRFNAVGHALACVSLCARGCLGTPPYLKAVRVLIKERASGWTEKDLTEWPHRMETVHV
jgi:hypothetical protein